MAETRDSEKQPQPTTGKTNGSSGVLTQDVRAIQEIPGQKTAEGKQHAWKHCDPEPTLPALSLRLMGGWFNFAYGVLVA